MSELEWQVSKQRACIREQRRRLRQQEKSRDLQDDSQKVEVLLFHPAQGINNDAQKHMAFFHELLLSYDKQLMMSPKKI